LRVAGDDGGHDQMMAFGQDIVLADFDMMARLGNGDVGAFQQAAFFLAVVVLVAGPEGVQVEHVGQFVVVEAGQRQVEAEAL
jgi:hypothetical protein